jgi:hypothetical protein
MTPRALARPGAVADREGVDVVDDTEAESRYYEDLGRVFHLGARLEWLTVKMLQSIAFDFAAHGQLVLAGLPMSGLLDRLEGIHALHADSERLWPALGEFIPAARRVVMLRNQLAHDQFVTVDKGETFRESQKHGYRWKPATASFLAEALAAMEAAHHLATDCFSDALRYRQRLMDQPSRRELLERLKDGALLDVGFEQGGGGAEKLP